MNALARNPAARSMRPRRPLRRAGRTLCAAAAWLLSALVLGQPALAQYKVVEPGGRVTYTDRPPTATPARPLAPQTQAASPAAGDDLTQLAAGLPYALRQVVQRWPVRLYTAAGCAPCATARQWLQRRGVPVLEYTVDRPEDAERFEREVAARELPVMTVGRQRHVGFGEADWSLTLDAAGYPAASALPGSWRAPAARPLAGGAPPDAAGRPDDAAAARPTAPPVVSPHTEGGFRF